MYSFHAVTFVVLGYVHWVVHRERSCFVPRSSTALSVKWHIKEACRSDECYRHVAERI